jgi:hypothetical protein
LLLPVLKDNPSSAPLGGLGDDGLEHPPDYNNGSLNDNNTGASKLPNDGDETNTDMDDLAKSARRYMAGIEKQIAEGLLEKYKSNSSGKLALISPT